MNKPPITMPDLISRRAHLHYITALNELARLGVDMTRIELLAVGEHQNYRGEVHEQSPAPGTELRPDTKVRLHIGYPSAADMLPHQFFVGLEPRPNAGHEWEDRARRLMAPFDAAVIRHDAWALYRVLKVSFGYIDRRQINQFLQIFAIPTPEVDLTERELLALSMVLPALHDWGGNAEAVSTMLELFFGYPVEITESVPKKYDIPPRLRYRLAAKESRLGIDTLLGKSFVECESAYRVTISNIEPDAIVQFLPGRSIRKKIDWLLRIIAPNNLVYELQLLPGRRRLALGNESESYLGYATFIRSGKCEPSAGSSA